MFGALFLRALAAHRQYKRQWRVIDGNGFHWSFYRHESYARLVARTLGGSVRRYRP